MPDRFERPWTVHNNESSYWLEDATGMRFGFTYYDDNPLAGTGRLKPTKRAARALTINFAKLPDAVLTVLDPDVRQALHLFMESRSEKLTEGEAVGLLVKDALIGLGDLPLSGANRGRAAGSKGR